MDRERVPRAVNSLDKHAVLISRPGGFRYSCAVGVRALRGL